MRIGFRNYFSFHSLNAKRQTIKYKILLDYIMLLLCYIKLAFYIS